MRDLQREKFEALFKSKWRKHALTLNYDLTYVDDVVQDAWVIWQAAIESVVIEFTEEPYFCPSKTEVEQASDNGYTAALTMVKKAITDAGVKYK